MCWTGYPSLSPDVEEGICQVLAHMWLDSEIYSGSGNDVASSSSSSSSSSPSSSSTPASSKKGKRSDFEKKLGEFFKHQIESDTSSAYGEGFRAGNRAVLKFGLKRTLDHIRMTGCFPWCTKHAESVCYPRGINNSQPFDLVVASIYIYKYVCMYVCL